MNLVQILETLKSSEEFYANVTAWRTIPAREAKYADFPESLDKRLREVLIKRGIKQLYSHQASAFEAVENGESIVVVTPTASGKTLCYNLPVLNEILKNPEVRALYLFPTKALSQDQLKELHELITLLGEDIKTYTYDGDTPQTARKVIRSAGHIVVTNPDMLHTGILPHHTKWVKLFENLKFVIIDEVHHYRGVFGSHVANVMRRLKRICKFYGSNPQFICASATIANPEELASKLIGTDVKLIDNNGAPSGTKEFIFYNPPVVNRELGIRRSNILEVKKIATHFLKNKIQTIVFTRSRLKTEILVSYLKKLCKDTGQNLNSIRGYRGGYLPKERRQIEAGLRSGEVLGVVSTNALELGIDIGQLEVCIMAGYPGSVASTWQQAGRAGRRSGTSAAILVASSSPLDQYVITHPEYFFSHPTEHGLINPNNLVILLSHIKCAAFELPFVDGEVFGVETTQEILEYLAEEKILRHVGGRWYWMSDSYPADDISLRSASPDNFVIIDITEPDHKVIGEMDRFSVPTMLHKDAIYIHESQQYHVDRLDWDEQKAYVRAVDVDYYTDANLAVDIKVLDEFEKEKVCGGNKSHGEVLVTAKATMFKKIKFYTHENVGYGDIHLPEQQMHTTAYWMCINPALAASFSKEELQSGLLGLSNLLVNVAPIYLMCDPRDIKVVAQIRSPFTNAPTLYLYDNYPGGVGFSEKLYAVHKKLLETAYELVNNCECEQGCPSCVGPVNEVGEHGKINTLKLLKGVYVSGSESQT
ncbi:ATP-dependent helicase [Anoxybacter fermentans]|uniref:ATP-dependent helicase n=1 Tax=Anoxybacter fermentans TaxID=1323375 RepID=A0A3S9SYL9_9FIRM|nr:DEAD/DEAH box helicase [Anoxybacter fermentans]AZR73360.1 ATP-dependent helicase [Anoxybacter fermentans]